MLRHPSYDLAAWRARIPLLATMIPMNNCSQAPQTDLSRAAAEQYLDSWNCRGMDWEAWIAEVDLAKREFAKLVGGAPDEIAIFGSVSDATSDRPGGSAGFVVTRTRKRPTAFVASHAPWAARRKGVFVVMSKPSVARKIVATAPAHVPM